ncbi:hypothetical protein AQV86_00020 [Nanohaloarchaea archaeon SG9]|nr:hypothetical protein AQV86_00020 [Nanohaloarchaea archaeon SG9]
MRALSSVWQNVPLAGVVTLDPYAKSHSQNGLRRGGADSKSGEGPGFKSLRVHQFLFLRGKIQWK